MVVVSTSVKIVSDLNKRGLTGIDHVIAKTANGHRDYGEDKSRAKELCPVRLAII